MASTLPRRLAAIAAALALAACDYGPSQPRADPRAILHFDETTALQPLVQ